MMMIMTVKKRATFLGFGILLLLAVAFPFGHARAASLTLSPAEKSLTVGQTFSVTVDISSPDQAMNAVSGDIAFPADKLRVLSVSQTDSIVNFWVQNPSFSNAASAGDVSFQGVALSPGFVGTAGEVVVVQFKAVAPGAAPVTFSSGSILANDGNGTNILSSMQGASYTIVAASSVPAPVSASENLPPAPVIMSATHPNESQWYNGKTLQLAWSLPAGVLGVSYALYSKSDFVLPSASKGMLSSVSYDLTAYREGMWYFYAKFHGANGWGPTALRQVRIDFSPPESFSVTEQSSGDSTDPQPVFSWATTDAMSGIKKYLVKIGDGDWFDASTIAVTSTDGEYQLPLQAPAQNTLLIVDAYDNAGNVTEATTTFSVAPLPAPSITSYAKTIASSRPVFTIQGVVPKGSYTRATTVRIYLRQSADVVAYSAPVDQDGHWSFDQVLNLPAGSWTLTAQAVDARGAMSSSTSPMIVVVGGWFSDAMNLLLSWTTIAIAGILFLAAIIAIAYLLTHRLRRWRLSMSRELIQERKELRDDLLRIEKSLDADRVGQKIDLSAAGIRKREERVRKEIDRLEEELKKDAKDLK
jgi:hypothetical protein